MYRSNNRYCVLTVPCQPSPCINGGNCSVVNHNNPMAYFCTCNEMFFGQFCEKNQKVQYIIICIVHDSVALHYISYIKAWVYYHICTVYGYLIMHMCFGD